MELKTGKRYWWYRTTDNGKRPTSGLFTGELTPKGYAVLVESNGAHSFVSANELFDKHPL